MKVTLISPYPDITSFGLRTISAYLKENGHTTQIIFLPDPYGDDLVYGKDRYDDRVLDEAVSLCEKSDLIGISLMTNFFDGAVQITRKIKDRLGIIFKGKIINESTTYPASNGLCERAS
jgi:hypothetical protein